MGVLRLALAQINAIVGDIESNGAMAADAIGAAEAAGADLVALPELALTGYPPEDLLLKASFVAANEQALSRLAGRVKGAAIVGFAERDGDSLFNSAALIGDGEVRGVYRKHVLPNYGVFDERRYFTPGEGILLGSAGDASFGVTICEDIWTDSGPHLQCRAAGAGLVININASPYHRGKGILRMALLEQRVSQLGVPIAYVNLVGGQDELVFDGQSLAVGAGGEVLAQAAQFKEEVLVFDIEVGGPGPLPSAASGAEALRVVRLASPREAGPRLARRIAEPLDPAGEVYQALVLGVGDYFAKNGFTQAVAGLSGGIDSSLTAAIAADAIGAGNVLGVMMPSIHTSEESNRYAKALASNLGMPVEVMAIPAAFEALQHALEPLFKGLPPGIAEENMQSRIRGALLMAISNKTGRIVLSTGNKSEIATGYATLYGDTVGGFAVLKDVPKTLVYELARWRNRGGQVIPDEVIERAPTAELAPGQLDTDSLPPYEVLDAILELYIEQDLGVEGIVAAGFDRETAVSVTGLVDRAEYKRRQSPVGVKITPKAFGRDRRLPITNRWGPS